MAKKDDAVDAPAEVVDVPVVADPEPEVSIEEYVEGADLDAVDDAPAEPEFVRADDGVIPLTPTEQRAINDEALAFRDHAYQSFIDAKTRGLDCEVVVVDPADDATD